MPAADHDRDTTAADPSEPGAAFGDTELGDRARAGIDHLQAAARELIQAARAVLDVAEQLVDDRDAVARAAASLGTLVHVGRGLVDEGLRRAGMGATSDADEDGAPDGRVERIRVS
jgi:hypothetical protein